jgi:cytochrome c oxidase subunit IV
LAGVQTPAEDRPYRSIDIPGVIPPGQAAAPPAAPAPAAAPVQLPPELAVRPAQVARTTGPQVRTSSSPGLTAPGVLVVIGAVSLVAMLVDTFTGGGIGWLFGALFILVSAYAALQVRREDLVWAVILPPLVFAVLVCSHAAYTAPGDALSKFVAMMNGLLDYGPMLWIGTGLAGAIAAWRRWGGSVRRS